MDKQNANKACKSATSTQISQEDQVSRMTKSFLSNPRLFKLIYQLIECARIGQNIFEVPNDVEPIIINITEDKNDDKALSPPTQIAQIDQVARMTDVFLSNSQLFNLIYQLVTASKKLKNKPTITNCDSNDEPLVMTPKELNLPKDLPPLGLLRMCSVQSGDKLYVNKFSKNLPWVEGIVLRYIKIFTDPRVHIKFKDDEKAMHFCLKEIAYYTASNVRYKVGTLVIANFKDLNPHMTNTFLPGIIAEEPKELNSFRYLIFFDDGSTKYAFHQEIRHVCSQSLNVYFTDGDLDLKNFIRSYLCKYPERRMVKFSKNQVVRANCAGRWHSAKVINIDASLIQLKYINTEHTEWFYRGSCKLELINQRNTFGKRPYTSNVVMTEVKKTLNKPYVKLDYEVRKNFLMETDNSQSLISDRSGKIKTLELPIDNPQPIPFKCHYCNRFCVPRLKYNVDFTTQYNILSIPLYHGFKRSIKKLKVSYTVPCGLEIDNEAKMHKYLNVTSQNDNYLTIDMFSFDNIVNPLNVYQEFMYFKYIKDISGGLELLPISAVNCVDNSIPPPIKYITKHKIMPGVNSNLDSKFLSCCDCIDNCEDKTKCSCWQQTLDGAKFYDFKNIGYEFKRLYEKVDTGIFECNINCKCSKTCLNRVVQLPVSARLQVFKTENKGWGLRTLTDIPRGSFICNYIGKIFNESDTEMNALDTGEKGDYVSNLDFIEVVSEIKDGYESDVKDPPEFGMNTKNFNIQHSGIEAKHKLIQLNSQQTTLKTPGNLIYRQYFDGETNKYVIDSKNAGNVSRFFNHSCDPNVFVQNVFVDTHDLRFPWQSYFASCFIPAGEELVYDYNYEVGSVDGTILYCNCKSVNCKGRLL